MSQTRLASARRLVVKVGSALVTNNGTGLDLNAIADWARQIAQLRQEGKEIILVSSGAVACGVQRLGWGAGQRRCMKSRLLPRSVRPGWSKPMRLHSASTA